MFLEKALALVLMMTLMIGTKRYLGRIDPLGPIRRENADPHSRGRI
jgi:hypothetical protein